MEIVRKNWEAAKEVIHNQATTIQELEEENKALKAEVKMSREYIEDLGAQVKEKELELEGLRELKRALVVIGEALER